MKNYKSSGDITSENLKYDEEQIENEIYDHIKEIWDTGLILKNERK